MKEKTHNKLKTQAGSTNKCLTCWYRTEKGCQAMKGDFCKLLNDKF